MQIINMENNIITQIYNDPKNTEPKELFEYVKELYEKYINSINNEIGENQYKNAEDSRILDNEIIFKANEFGFCINNDELLRVGSCIRKLYFQLTGAIGEPRKVQELEVHERNKLIIDQWIKKLDFLKIIEKPEHKVITQAGIKIETTENAFIYDARKNTTFALIIKPINDTAFSIRDIIFPTFSNIKPQILNTHIPEIILNMLILKQPVKLLYVGKNNPEMIKEFDCGITRKKLVVNGEVKEEIDVTYIFEEIKQIAYALLEKVVPPRKYKEYKALNKKQISDLFELKFINKKEMTEILNGDSYINFYCKDCRYRNICNAISEDWVKIE